VSNIHLVNQIIYLKIGLVVDDIFVNFSYKGPSGKTFEFSLEGYNGRTVCGFL